VTADLIHWEAITSVRKSKDINAMSPIYVMVSTCIFHEMFESAALDVARGSLTGYDSHLYPSYRTINLRL
jgi:hypothetical protein